MFGAENMLKMYFHLMMIPVHFLLLISLQCKCITVQTICVCSYKIKDRTKLFSFQHKSSQVRALNSEHSYERNFKVVVWHFYTLSIKVLKFFFSPPCFLKKILCSKSHPEFPLVRSSGLWWWNGKFLLFYRQDPSFGSMTLRKQHMTSASLLQEEFLKITLHTECIYQDIAYAHGHGKNINNSMAINYWYECFMLNCFILQCEVRHKTSNSRTKNMYTKLTLSVKILDTTTYFCKVKKTIKA